MQKDIFFLHLDIQTNKMLYVYKEKCNKPLQLRATLQIRQFQ